MARNVVDCLWKKHFTREELKEIQEMTSQKTNARLRIPRSVTKARVERFEELYTKMVDNAGNTPRAIRDMNAAKEALDLATASLEAKQLSISLSIEKSNQLIESVGNALKLSNSLKDAANSVAFRQPNLRYEVQGTLQLSAEETITGHRRVLESAYQKAFSNLSDEAKFALIEQDPQMSKAIAADYFNATSKKQRSSPKAIQEIVDVLIQVDKDVVDMLKARGVFIPNDGIDAYLAGLNSVGERVASVTRKEYIADMMKWDSSVNQDRLRKIIPDIHLKSTEGTSYQGSPKEQLYGYLYDMEVKGRVTDMPPALKFLGRRIQSSREHMRIVQFNNVEGWMAYQQKYGTPLFGDVIKNYVDRTAKTLGVLDTYGPNPSEAINRLLNKFRPTMNKQQATAFEREVVLGMEYWLKPFEDPLTPNKRSLVSGITNLLRGAMLGAHSIEAALVEAPIIASRANAFAGLPVTKYLSSWLKDASHLGDYKLQREVLNRAGYFTEDFMYDLNNGFSSQTMTRFEKSTGWMAKAVEKMSLSKIITMTTRRAVSENFMNGFHDFVKSGGKDKALNSMLGNMLFPTPHEKSFGRYLNSFGITDEDISKFKPFIENFGTKESPFNRVNITKMYQSGDESLNELAVKLQAAVQNLTQGASPQSNKQMTAHWRKATESNQLSAAAAGFGMQFTGYITDFTKSVVRLTKYSGMAPQVATLAALAILATVGGMASIQSRMVLTGREPLPIGGDLLLQGFMKSGITGKMGDMIFSYGQNPMGGFVDGLFPVASVFENTWKVGANAVKAAQGKKTSWGRDTVDLLKGLTPGGNLWWARLPLEREVFDQLKKLSDESAFNKSTKQRRTKLRKEGSDFWWSPGDRLPKF